MWLLAACTADPAKLPRRLDPVDTDTGGVTSTVGPPEDTASTGATADTGPGPIDCSDLPTGLVPQQVFDIRTTEDFDETARLREQHEPRRRRPGR